jgi:hypothetical protein
VSDYKFKPGDRVRVKARRGEPDFNATVLSVEGGIVQVRFDSGYGSNLNGVPFPALSLESLPPDEDPLRWKGDAKIIEKLRRENAELRAKLDNPRRVLVDESEIVATEDQVHRGAAAEAENIELRSFELQVGRILGVLYQAEGHNDHPAPRAEVLRYMRETVAKAAECADLRARLEKKGWTKVLELRRENKELREKLAEAEAEVRRSHDAEAVATKLLAEAQKRLHDPAEPMIFSKWHRKAQKWLLATYEARKEIGGLKRALRALIEAQGGTTKSFGVTLLKDATGYFTLHCDRGEVSVDENDPAQSTVPPPASGSTGQEDNQ